MARYVELVRWLFSDSIIRNRWMCARIISSGILATVLEINAIALIVYYGGLLSKGESIDLLGNLFNARASFQLLIMVASSTFLLLIGSALLTWYSRLSTLRLRKLYELFCSNRALEIISSGVWFPLISKNEATQQATLTRIVRMDSRYCGRIMVALLTSIPPLVIAIIACVGLFVINPTLTSGVFVLLGVACVVTMRIGVSGAKASVEIESNQKLIARSYKSLISKMKSSSADIVTSDNWLKKNLFDTPEVNSYYKFYEKRLRVTEHSQFTSNILLATCILVITIVLGHQAISTNAGWEQLVIYLLALRYALVNVKRIFTKITNINRFYPQLRRYLDFINTVYPPCEPSAGIHPITVASPKIKDSLKELNLEPGQKYSLIWNKEVSSLTLPLLLHHLYLDSSEVQLMISNSWAIGIDSKQSTGTEYYKERFRQQINELSEDFNEPLSKILDDGAFNDSLKRLAILLAEANLRKKQLVVIDTLAVEDLEQFHLIHELFCRDLACMFVYNKDIEIVPSFQESLLIIMGEDGVCGMGDLAWYQKNSDAIRALNKFTTNSIEDFDDEEEEDE